MNNTSKNHFFAFDVIKLFLAYEIAFSHIRVFIPPVGVAVELFFIISGFFLAYSFYRRKNILLKPFEFTRYRITRFIKIYLISFFALLIYQLVKLVLTTGNVMMIFNFLYERLPELFLLQNVGFIGQGGINYPLWQLCALIIAEHFAYSMLYYYEEKSYHFYFPLIILLGFSYLYNFEIGHNTWGIDIFLPMPIFRAFIPLLLGIMFYKIIENINSNYSVLLKKTRLINLLFLITVLLLVLKENYLQINLIVEFFLILCCFNPRLFLNKIAIFINDKFIKIIGDLSLAIYMSHALVIDILNDMNIMNNYTFLLFLSLYSILLLFVVKKISIPKLKLRKE